VVLGGDRWRRRKEGRGSAISRREGGFGGSLGFVRLGTKVMAARGVNEKEASWCENARDFLGGKKEYKTCHSGNSVGRVVVIQVVRSVIWTATVGKRGEEAADGYKGSTGEPG